MPPRGSRSSQADGLRGADDREGVIGYVRWGKILTPATPKGTLDTAGVN